MKSIRDSYFVVQGWMTVELGLSGLDLMVYAVIWGYCQNTQSYFYGSRQYIADMTGGSIRGVQKSLQKLQDKELIINIGKHPETNTIKYIASKSVNEGTECTGTECTNENALSAQGVGTECTLDREQSAHNNIYNKLDDNIGDNIVSSHSGHVSKTIEKINRLDRYSHTDDFPEKPEPKKITQKKKRSSSKKNSENKETRSSCSNIIQTYTEQVDELIYEHRLSEKPFNDYSIATRLIKNHLKNYSEEQIISAIRNAKNDNWIVSDRNFSFNTILSQKVLNNLVNKIYIKSDEVKINKGQSAFVDKNRDYENNEGRF